MSLTCALIEPSARDQILQKRKQLLLRGHLFMAWKMYCFTIHDREILGEAQKIVKIYII